MFLLCCSESEQFVHDFNYIKYLLTYSRNNSFVRLLQVVRLITSFIAQSISHRPLTSDIYLLYSFIVSVGFHGNKLYSSAFLKILLHCEGETERASSLKSWDFRFYLYNKSKVFLVGRYLNCT